MEFKLPRLKISRELSLFASKKLKENEIRVPRASKDILIQLAAISQVILKEGIPNYLVLRKLKGKLGHGIFLHPDVEPILKGDVIAPYSGEVFLSQQREGNDSDYVFSLVPDLLLTKNEQLLLDPKSRYHPRRLYSLDLDAEKEGNFTRFINHCDKPNVEADFLRIPTNSLGLEPSPFEILYRAKKTIRPGEQLLVCYDGDDKSYWGALKIKPFPMTPKTFQVDSSLKIVSSKKS